MTPQTMWRAVWQLAWPVCCEELSLLCMGVGLTVLAGRYGTPALAAFGLVGTVLSALLLLCAALGTGVASVLVRHAGGHDRRRVNVLAGQGLWLSLLLAGPLLYAMWRLVPQVPDVLEPAAAHYVHQWLPLVALSAPWCLLGAVGRRILQAVGRTDAAFAVNALTQLVALGGALLAARGWPSGLGADGLICGLACGQVVGALAVLAVLQSPWGLALRWRDLGRPRPAMLVSLARISAPVVLEQAAQQGGFVLHSFMLAKTGAVQFAAYDIALQVEAVPLILGSALAVVTLVLTGRYIGRDEPAAAAHFIRRLTLLGMGGMTAVSLLFWPVAAKVAALFSRDAAVLAWATPCIMLMALEQPAMAGTIIMGQALRGAGDTRRPLYSTIAGMWLARLPLEYVILVLWHGPVTAAWVITAADYLVRCWLLYPAVSSLRAAK